jgi:small-conductance mechanosensitive channel
MDFEILDKVIFGNTLEQYIRFGFTLGGWLVVILILKAVIRFRKKKVLFSNPDSVAYFVLENVIKYIAPVFYIFAVYSGLKILHMHSAVEKGIDIIWLFSLVFYLTRFVLAILSWMIQNFWKDEKTEELDTTTIVLLTTIVKVIVWVIAFLILLDNMGIKISGLIAGVGIGGIAIAFASQAILGDVFNYFTIFFDKPFEIGDFILIDEHKGNVEYIGLKSTRIKSLNGEQLVFSNTDLTNSRIRNFKRMTERRVVFTFGVTYQTPVKTLKKILDLVKKIIDDIEDIRFDRAHFHKFGDSSLDFEVVYYVQSSDYAIFMDKQQEINFQLMEGIKKLKADFAYPTRTVFIEK